MTPVTDSKYTFGDQLKNPFTTQQTFSNDSLAQQFQEKLNCSKPATTTINVAPSHRRNASEASFLTKQFNNFNSQSSSINDTVNLHTASTSSLSDNNFDQNNRSLTTQLNPFDDSFTNEQVIDHLFDEFLVKRDEDRRK